MEPFADIDICGKKTTCKLDTESSLYRLVVKYLMSYTLSQNIDELPVAMPLALLLPKRMNDKVIKQFKQTPYKLVYHINESWTYVWCVRNTVEDNKTSGWYFDGKKVKGYENQT